MLQSYTSQYEVENTESKERKSIIFIIASFLLAVFTIIPFYESLNEVSYLFYLKYISFVFFVLLLIIKNKVFLINYRALFLLYIITLSGVISLINVGFNSLGNTVLYLIVSIGIAVSTELVFRKINIIDFNKIIWIFLIAISLFVLAPSILTLNFSSSYYTSAEGRFRFVGIFNNSNELARFCLLSFFIGMRLLLDIKKNIKRKTFLYFIIALSFYIIFLTNSRTSLIISILGLIIYIFINMYSKSKKNTLLISYFLIGCISATVLVKFSKEITTFNFNEINYLLSGRLNSWSPILNQSFKDIMLGSGNTRTGLASTVVLVNGYIELIKYTGVIGLICWMFLIVHFLIKKIMIAFKTSSKSSLQGVSIILLLMLYYFFEGGLVSIGNLVSIYFWLEISQI